MKLDFAELSDKFAAMAVRERVLLFLFAIIGPICAWDYAYLSPLEKEQKSVQSHVTELGALNQIQTNGVMAAVKTASLDPDSSVHDRLARLQGKLAGAKVKLESLTQDLISPEQMATVLQDLLKSDSGLRLVSFENLPTVALNGAEDAVTSAEASLDKTATEDTSALLYQHSLKMEFEGSYKSAQTYLQTLEGMPWRLYWDAIEFDVVEYPVARVRMTVHTLSLGEGWIGV